MNNQNYRFPLIKDEKQAHEIMEAWASHVTSDFQKEKMNEYVEDINRCPICGRGLKDIVVKGEPTRKVCPLTEFEWKVIN